MDSLIYELKTLESWKFSSNKKYLNDYKCKSKFKESLIKYKLNKILCLLDELLINGSGKCDWANISILNNNGYYVGPGERDSFGWLTGVVYTDKGCIVYG
jgi:hypothetical protein